VFYLFLYPLYEKFFAFNVFRYITFRSAYATITALLIFTGGQVDVVLMSDFRATDLDWTRTGWSFVKITSVWPIAVPADNMTETYIANARVMISPVQELSQIRGRYK